jgi:elongation factor G
VVPKEYIPGVEKGIKSVMDSGPLAGFPVIDFKVALIDGAYHDVDSSVLAFEIAARCGDARGAQEGRRQAAGAGDEGRGGDPGGIHRRDHRRSDLRRGQVTGQDSRGNAVAINAFVPLANMFGYINTLRSMSSGRANFTMQFDHYEAVPQNISDEIQKKYATEGGAPPSPRAENDRRPSWQRQSLNGRNRM